MKLVIHPPVEPARLEQIVEAAASMTVVNAATDEEALQSIATADAFFGKLTPPMLAASQQLRWVQSPTASLEHYLFPELTAHPLTLTNMRGLFSDVIADHVMGYLICFARNFHHYIRQQAEARWAPVGGEQARANFASGPGMVSAIDLAHPQLAGQTVGIVGLGEIGREIAVRAAAFGIECIAVDPHTESVPTTVRALWPVDQLPRLLSESDFVVIAAPHTPQTAGMFRRQQFQQMKPSAYLINIGRGAIVNLADLNAALDAGEIAGAGLDVFEVEPLPASDPLWRQPGVIITPHVAGLTAVVAQRHLAVLLDNIRRFVSGQTLNNVVDKTQWY